MTYRHLPPGYLVALIDLLGFLCLALMFTISKLNMLGSIGISEVFIIRVVSAFVFFIWGLGGVVVILREEFPQGFGIIRGRPAVVWGICIRILGWLISCYILIYTIMDGPVS